MVVRNFQYCFGGEVEASIILNIPKTGLFSLSTSSTRSITRRFRQVSVHMNFILVWCFHEKSPLMLLYKELYGGGVMCMLQRPTKINDKYEWKKTINLFLLLCILNGNITHILPHHQGNPFRHASAHIANFEASMPFLKYSHSKLSLQRWRWRWWRLWWWWWYSPLTITINIVIVLIIIVIDAYILRNEQ